MTKMVFPTIVQDLLKNATRIIRVQINEYSGKPGVDIRVHYEDDQGEWKPTRKGLWLTPDLLMATIESLEQARQQCVELGFDMGIEEE